MSSNPFPDISVAPMMDWTDKHCRYFLRLIAPNVKLYTEMITMQAIKHGDQDYLLSYNHQEHPLALQLGGSDPALLAACAEIGEQYGYDEINLNVGCPSSRVKAGRFGACLMLEPKLVADCIYEMQKRVRVPVTLKCRIGVDDVDAYEDLHHFITLNAEAGCRYFIIHARKAWLSGLSPKENRSIPPLQYEIVYQLKQDFPHLKIVMNGGIQTAEDVAKNITAVDGVMIGRAAYHNPYLLAALQQTYFPETTLKSRQEVVAEMIPYIESQIKHGTRLQSITRHMLGLHQGQPGGKAWRRFLSEHTHTPDVIIAKLKESVY